MVHKFSVFCQARKAQACDKVTALNLFLCQPELYNRSYKAALASHVCMAVLPAEARQQGYRPKFFAFHREKQAINHFGQSKSTPPADHSNKSCTHVGNHAVDLRRWLKAANAALKRYSFPRLYLLLVC